MSGARRLPAELPQAWRGETYHGRPVVKASGFDWKVSTYIVLLGIAGSAQVIAAVAGRGRADPGLVRHARLLALAGSVVGPIVLVRHLKTPRRWYNMLRIVRPTSPMSLGSWLLTAFGALSGIVAAGDLLGGRWRFARRLAGAAQAPVAVAGAGMSVYTASLLASTSTPLWASAPAGLAAQFGTASMASAASALALAQRATGDQRGARRLENLAMAATAAELAAASMTEQRWRRDGVAEGAHGGGGKLLSTLAPLAAHAAGRALGGGAERALPVAASIAVLVGGALMRHAILEAGNAGARRPEAAFRVAQEVRR